MMRRLPMAALAFLGLAMFYAAAWCVLGVVLGDYVQAVASAGFLVVLIVFCVLAGRPRPRDPR